MKPVLTKRTFALFFGLAALAAVVFAQQPQAVLGKIDFSALFNAAPALPASTAEASRRTYGPTPTANAETAALENFYAPFAKRVEAARNGIKPALDTAPQRQEAMAQQAVSDANNSPIIAGMGGIDKMSQMSDEEREQAAMQAAANYQQSLAGGPNQVSGGMQVIMQRVMNDPAYREKFEKMTPAEQEAEMKKAMGPGAPVAQHTAAEEERAMRLPNEAKAVLDKQNDLVAIHQRIVGIDTENNKKEQDIKATPGSHEQIARDIAAKIKKIPLVDGGEAGPMPDPAQYNAALRERATLDRTRANWELQQRAALFAKRRTDYTQVAASYSAWLQNNVGPASGSAAKLVQQGTIETALRCEEELIGLADRLAKYSQSAAYDAAIYELAYQKAMSQH